MLDINQEGDPGQRGILGLFHLAQYKARVGIWNEVIYPDGRAQSCPDPATGDASGSPSKAPQKTEPPSLPTNRGLSCQLLGDAGNFRNNTQYPPSKTYQDTESCVRCFGNPPVHFFFKML